MDSWSSLLERCQLPVSSQKSNPRCTRRNLQYFLKVWLWKNIFAGRKLGKTAPLCLTLQRPQSNTAPANPKKSGLTSTVLVSIFFNNKMKLRLFSGTISLREGTLSAKRQEFKNSCDSEKSWLEIFQKTSSCVPKAVPVCKTKPVKKCTKVSSQDIKSIKWH